MDADQHDVVVTEKELYHLLRPTVDICLYQPSEFRYSMVDMHDIVARLYLLQLLQAQRQFPSPCAVALQIVFVIAVENLMVGEEAYLPLMIHESFMDRAVPPE